MPHVMQQIGTRPSRADYVALCEPVPCRDPLSAPSARPVTAGATVPVKWRVLDGDGVPVADAGHFAGVTSTAPREPDEPARGSGPVYLGDGYWRFAWETPAAYAGQLRTMTLWLCDGSARSALLRFC